MRGSHESAAPQLEVLSYVLSFGTFYLFVWFAKRKVNSPSFRRDGGCLSSLVESCVAERLDPVEKEKQAQEKANRGNGDGAPAENFGKTALHVCFCILGIQVSYLLWGLKQERIMTQVRRRTRLRHRAWAQR